eukprot:g75220.t1
MPKYFRFRPHQYGGKVVYRSKMLDVLAGMILGVHINFTMPPGGCGDDVVCKNFVDNVLPYCTKDIPLPGDPATDGYSCPNPKRNPNK